MQKTAVLFTIILAVLSTYAAETSISAGVVRNGLYFDTFYYDQNGYPQYFKVVKKGTSKSWPVVTFYGSRPMRLNGTVGISFKESVPEEKRTQYLKKFGLRTVNNDHVDPDY